jgi:hypothetical protein
MSMSNEMVKEYVKHKLATAVSAGILMGRTETAAGHTHKFAVMFCETDKMFVGETSFDGRGPHCHYIMAGIRDVVESHLGNPPQPRTEDDVVLEVNEANSPAALRKALDFYNLKEVRLESNTSGSDEHSHAVVLRYAGKNVDKMGRKVQAGVKFEQDDEIDKIKAKRDTALAELENRLNKVVNPDPVEKPAPVVEKIKEEPKVEAGESLADRIVAECRKKAMSVEAELEARLKEHGVTGKCGQDHEKK